MSAWIEVRPVRRRQLVMALAATALLGSAASAQERCDQTAGTLGIQGMRCEGCSFRMSESGLEEARFRTEPEIVAVARGFTRGGRLRPGDRIVAIDGALITTRAGSGRLVALRAGQAVTVRVRRDGEVTDLRMVAGSACELRARDEIQIDRLEESRVDVIRVPPVPRAAPLPPVPAAPRPPKPGAVPEMAPLPPMPAVPLPPPLAPSGYLGFGISCSECGMRDDVFFFTSPPTVEDVAEGGPARRAGLRSGDALLEIDGVEITSARGGRRFTAIEPGDSVRLTVRRGGATRVVTVVAEAGPMARARAAVIGDRLRYEGRLGATRIEVRGAPVRVTRDEATGEVVIRTSDTVIVLKRGG
ncbi:MAG: PDZ domain-containing protein [Gemmatimonadetes bacterium]|nr:PDZ domain-containing protein [Gemmatimonadota bacterium]NIQ57299.1 PDZ domain-containing protein [Gemmatimonadota bacterium]NIU77459.1 PDZ domain-containing protein [Gammaproteobacteria bacterium]NIX46683.1 PDZ domain-containing protein [Gemmatimonadota bacterium]NIY11026.1 PDZ domain-containing protein [Gemmatimonadota bacterium]